MGLKTIPTYRPLASQLWFYNWLQSQVGNGATPFNGPVAAPDNQLLTQLMSFFTRQSGLKYQVSLILGEMAQTGDPTNSPCPHGQPMRPAQQQNIQKQQANLKEQFAAGGNLTSSPYGNAMAGFNEQTTADQNALLAQMTQQASEAAMGRKLSAEQTMTQGAEGTAQFEQQTQQSDINAQLQEFIRTQPEYSPLLNMFFGGATNTPGTFKTANSSLLGLLDSHSFPVSV